MDPLKLVESFSEFKDLKNIDRETLMQIITDVLKTMLEKKFSPSARFDFIVNVDRGDLEIYWIRTIVEDDQLVDKNTQIAYSEAIKIEPDFEVGEDLYEEIKLSVFGRREIQSIRQNLINKVLEHEKESIYKKYKDKIGEIVAGEVYQIGNKELLVRDDEEIELTLPKSEMIPADRYRKGDTIRAVVLKVDMRQNVPQIILSRTSPVFLEKLIEQEVPEVYDGLITIRKIVRVPGERAKVAVDSYDDRIDPVGAVVGMRGTRIHSIVRELRNENIDVIQYSSNPALFIQRALSPAKISSIKIDEKEKKAEVFMKADQVSLAIGRGGNNIRLAGRLTGYEIEVYRDSDYEDEDDVILDEFADEIDQWVIDRLKSIGCVTAKDVLNIDRDDLVRRADLDEETIDEVIKILKAEFE